MEKNVLKSIGKRVRDLRKQRGFSQEELGELAGFHFSYIGGVERAEKNVTILNLQKIADSLNVPLSELFVFDKPKLTGKSDKDALINQIIDSLIEMKISDLRKVKLLLDEVFER